MLLQVKRKLNCIDTARAPSQVLETISEIAPVVKAGGR